MIVRSVALALLFAVSLAFSQSKPKTTHVIWVMTDGLRVQEFFQGADPTLLTKENRVGPYSKIKQDFGRENPATARTALLPFVWSVIAKQGQIYGNRKLGSDAVVNNGFNLSYPGYNESLTGASDPRVSSNDKKVNPNTSILEWLSQKPAFRGKVAAFAAWDTFPFILNAAVAHFPVNAGFDPFNGLAGNQQIQLLNDLKAEAPRDWSEEPFDDLPFHTALEYLKQRKPRVLFLSLGETDEWAHDGNYGEYLRAAHRVDAYLKTLWEQAQSMPEYRGVTTLIVSTDHGRGDGDDWRAHGRARPDSKYIWLGFLGPDTPVLGERRNIQAVTATQLAATLAALLGENYTASVSGVGLPISDVLTKHTGR